MTAIAAASPQPFERRRCSRIGRTGRGPGTNPGPAPRSTRGGQAPTSSRPPNRRRTALRTHPTTNRTPGGDTT